MANDLWKNKAPKSEPINYEDLLRIWEECSKTAMPEPPLMIMPLSLIPQSIVDANIADLDPDNG